LPRTSLLDKWASGRGASQTLGGMKRAGAL
jgi:hypothetical protein